MDGDGRLLNRLARLSVCSSTAPSDRLRFGRLASQRPGFIVKEGHHFLFPYSMAIQPKTKGLAHVALRTTDFARAKAFYHDLLGFPIALETPEILGFLVGTMFLGFYQQAQPTYPGGSTFTPFNVGLDHLAIACEDEAELHRVADALQAAGVENTGVKQDTVGPMKYVAFKDPRPHRLGVLYGVGDSCRR